MIPVHTIISYETCPCEGCKIYRKEKGVPEPVSAYGAEVRRIAELLAHIHHDRTSVHDTGYKFKEYSKPSQQAIAKEFIPEARAMVAEMAILIQQLAYDIRQTGTLCIVTDTYLIERGLIPSPENENI